MELITAETPKITTTSWPYWWLLRIEGTTVSPETPQMTFAIAFIFIRGNRDENGLWAFSKDSADIKSLSIGDAFAFAASEAQRGNMQPALLMQNILSTGAAVAKQQGVID